MPRNLSQDSAQVFINMIGVDDVSLCTKERVDGFWLKLLSPIDQVMNGLVPLTYREFLHTAHMICGHQALVPQSLEIPLCYDPNEQPAYGGGSADVWKGQHHGKEVAAKVLRLPRKNDLEWIRSVGCWWCSLDLLCPLTVDHVY